MSIQFVGVKLNSSTGSFSLELVVLNDLTYVKTRFEFFNRILVYSKYKWLYKTLDLSDWIFIIKRFSINAILIRKIDYRKIAGSFSYTWAVKFFQIEASYKL